MSNSFLDQVHSEQAEQAKAAAGEPIYETTPREDFELHYSQQAQEAQAAITSRVESMTAWAKQSREILNRTSQWDFAARQKTAAQVRELKAKYDAALAEIGEIRQECRKFAIERRLQTFNADVDDHLSRMEVHFKDGDFVPNRF